MGFCWLGQKNFHLYEINEAVTQLNKDYKCDIDNVISLVLLVAVPSF